MTMAKLIYTTISSLDGYVADDEGNFEWSAPDEEVHRFVNDLERPIGIHLLHNPEEPGYRKDEDRAGVRLSSN
jgi:hypothetical protein